MHSLIRFRQACSRTLIVCALILVVPLVTNHSSLLLAQSESASVSGRVTDQSNAVLPDAEVELRNADTGVSQTTKTNGEGFYTFPFVKPGNYIMSVRKQSFQTVSVTGMKLNVQDNVSRNFVLQIGSSAESITVNASDLQVNTTDASVSTIIDRQFAENLPLNGRSFQALLYLTPGVTLNMGSGVTSGWAPGQFTVNGQRADSNYWMVDGVSANMGINAYGLTFNGSAGGLGAFNVTGGTNGLVSVDALQEFRIQTSSYAPEFGRTPGGQITIVTRSGTSSFHGTLFDYFRNTVLDATDWFANANSLPKAAEQQNDFGGVFGGPIIKDKTFFFFSYEGLRLRLPQTYLTTVPDIATRQQAVPAIQPFIDAYPLPNLGAADIPCSPAVPCFNGSSGLAPFKSSFSDPASVNAYSLRIDHTLNKNLSIFGRYNYSPSNINQRGGGQTANSVNMVTSNITTGTVGATWSISPQIVDEARFNYSVADGSVFIVVDNFGGGSVPPGDSVFPSSFTYKNAVLAIAPLFGTNMNMYQGKNSANEQHQYNVVNTLSVQRGGHSLKFGFDYRRLSPYNSTYTYGSLPLFGTLEQMAEGQTVNTLIFNRLPVTFLFHNLGAFAQDTWRVSPRLTLTYGLRWDVDFTPTAEHGLSLPVVTGFSRTDLSNLALAPLGTPPYSTQYGNVAPRIGVAYQISSSADWGLVLRGGFGVFYDLASTEVGGQINANAYPLGINVSLGGVPFPTPAADAGLPPVVPPNATQGTLQGLDPHLTLPYSLQWNAALQQGLGRNQTLTASYVGSSGNRLLATENITNPNANYAAATLVANASKSSYNALQIQFQRRLTNGLQALASYTWSHSSDTGSYGAYADGTFADVNANRGDSDFDIRNTFSMALTYDVPVFGRSALTKALFGGWSTENILQVHSAPPVDVIDGAFSALTAQSASIIVRPDLVPGQPLFLYGSQYPGGKTLNPNAFASPPVDPTTGLPLRQGDLGRNTLRGFGLTQWDFAVHRDFPIRERLKLQFRAEMFNVLNHPNFAPYNSSFGIGDPYFGQSTQMLGASLSGLLGSGTYSSLYQIGGQRSIQLALKLSF